MLSDVWLGSSRRDPDEAFALFSEAAEQHYPPAQHKLGQCYMRGQGTKADMRLAGKWLTLAAETIPAAQMELNMISSVLSNLSDLTEKNECVHRLDPRFR